ncbi:MAG: M20/M25/M40 family metallo-hydrolase [candidate division WOR-3 bacterium]
MNNNANYLDKILEKLCKANGIGYAGEIKDILVGEIKPYTDDARIFPDGSVYGLIKGMRNVNVMLACHIDEIGFIVSSIEDNGFIRFKQVGGCDDRILPGQEVVILGKKEIKGYVGAKPPHLMKKEEVNKVMTTDKLFIDTGLKPEVLKKFVDIGDFICFAGYYNKLQGDFRSAKALDNRSSIACAILVLRELSELGSPVNLHFVATNQEEFSGLGARIHSYRLSPDYCVVIDVTHGEYPGLSEGEYFSLNKGPVIARGATIPQKLYKLLTESAQSKEIPYQIEPLPSYTGTDADAIAFNKEGIPTCVLGIPLRYMHTPIEVVCLKDIERTARLVIEFIKKL